MRCGMTHMLHFIIVVLCFFRDTLAHDRALLHLLTKDWVVRLQAVSFNSLANGRLAPQRKKKQAGREPDLSTLVRRNGLDLEVHAAHAAAAAHWHCGAGVLLRLVGDHGFRRDEEARH